MYRTCLLACTLSRCGLPDKCRPCEGVKGQVGHSLLAEDGVPCTESACGVVARQPNRTRLPCLPPPLTTGRAPSGAPLLISMCCPM